MAKSAGRIAMTALALAIALVSLRYLIPGAPGGAPPILANAYAKTGALTVHVAFAVVALAIGPWQFSARLRARRPSLHRRLGTLYLLACLLGGGAGLVLALGSTAGPIATAGFGALALIWIGATVQAWRLARTRKFAAHRRWMMRSFALTFAAVTLRIYLPIAAVAGVDFLWAYRAISFLCWAPNLAVAEWLIASGRRAVAPVAA